jgi:hypothetical protein
MSNKPLTHTLCAMALALVTATSAAAQVIATRNDNVAYGGTSGEFLLLGAGARGAALGGAYAALATDVTALYYNPGGLAQMRRPQAMVSTYDYIAGTRYSWLGIAFPLAGGARSVGLSAGTFGFSDQPVYTVDNPDGDGRTYSVAETFIAGSYGQNFSDRFSAGFTVKFINDKLGETRAGAFAVDFGTNFHATIGERPIRASFVLQNLGSPLRHDGAGLAAGVTRTPPLGTPNVPQELQPARLRATGWNLPVLFRVSAALDVYNAGPNRITVLSEFDQPNNNKPGAGAGLEWAGTNLGNSGFSLAARGSYTIQPANDISDIDLQGLTSSQSSGSFTKYGLAFGGGISYGKSDLKLGFDYAWRDLGPLGGTNYLSFSVGW